MEQKGNKKVVIGVVIVAIIAIVAVVCSILLKGNKNEIEEKKEENKTKFDVVQLDPGDTYLYVDEYVYKNTFWGSTEQQMNLFQKFDNKSKTDFALFSSYVTSTAEKFSEYKCEDFKELSGVDVKYDETDIAYYFKLDEWRYDGYCIVPLSGRALSYDVVNENYHRLFGEGDALKESTILGEGENVYYDKKSDSYVYLGTKKDSSVEKVRVSILKGEQTDEDKIEIKVNLVDAETDKLMMEGKYNADDLPVYNMIFKKNGDKGWFLSNIVKN